MMLQETDLTTAAPPTVNLGAMRGSVGFLLRLAQIDAFAKYYGSLDRIGLKPGEFSVLYAIGLNPAIRQGILAETLRIKRAHMTKLIRGFEARGLVARCLPDDDRRAVELNLTVKGQQFVADHSPEIFAQFAREAETLAPDEAQTLIHLLQKLTGTGATP